MIRKIIRIDEAACNGCGACAAACHEGAIGMVDGKARLLRDDYCDGLGDCLPVCPVDAISFEEREAAAYDEAAVQAAQRGKQAVSGGCPSAMAKRIGRQAEECASPEAPAVVSRLSQWPVQIKLAPVRAAYFDGADLLIAADCSAYAYGDFHSRFIKDRIVLIGCPKLDGVAYAEKLAAILRENDVGSVTVVRMEVPCCGGLEHAAKEAVQVSGKRLACRVAVVSTDGKILRE